MISVSTPGAIVVSAIRSPLNPNLGWPSEDSLSYAGFPGTMSKRARTTRPFGSKLLVVEGGESRGRRRQIYRKQRITRLEYPHIFLKEKEHANFGIVKKVEAQLRCSFVLPPIICSKDREKSTAEYLEDVPRC